MGLLLKSVFAAAPFAVALTLLADASTYEAWILLATAYWWRLMAP